MNRSRDPKHYFQKKSARKELGYPLARVAYYGPDDQFASKVVATILRSESDPGDILRQVWLSNETDVRQDPAINRAMLEFFQQHDIAQLALMDHILGCPHQKGIDYPQDEDCPFCPFWSR